MQEDSKKRTSDAAFAPIAPPVAPLHHDNILAMRYASPRMQVVWQTEARYIIWRQIWAALATAQATHTKLVTKEQAQELTANITNIDFKRAAEHERNNRHDVMAHLKTYREQCPLAGGIIHLGATSCDITDNGDVVQIRLGMDIVRRRLMSVCYHLAKFSNKYKKLPTLGYTHLQAAQPVTVGKRSAMWLHAFLMDSNRLACVTSFIKSRGLRGATGTQAAMLELCGNNPAVVASVSKTFLEVAHLPEEFDVSGQTYPRKMDYEIASVFSSIAQSAMSLAGDIRHLMSIGEIAEPREPGQVGSSTMAYKRNPVLSERITSLSRFLMGMPQNFAATAGTQWFERSLDDSAIRRIDLPNMFLAVDGVLHLVEHVAHNLVVNETTINANLRRNMPFLVTENILMQAAARGGDRQELHEIIRVEANNTVARMQEHAADNDLIARLKTHPEFACIDDMDALTNPSLYIGLCDKQVDNLLVRHFGGPDSIEQTLNKSLYDAIPDPLTV